MGSMGGLRAAVIINYQPRNDAPKTKHPTVFGVPVNHSGNIFQLCTASLKFLARRVEGQVWSFTLQTPSKNTPFQSCFPFLTFPDLRLWMVLPETVRIISALFIYYYYPFKKNPNNPPEILTTGLGSKRIHKGFQGFLVWLSHVFMKGRAMFHLGRSSEF